MDYNCLLSPRLCTLLLHCAVYFILNLYYILYCSSPAVQARSVWPRKLTSSWAVVTPQSVSQFVMFSPSYGGYGGGLVAYRSQPSQYYTQSYSYRWQIRYTRSAAAKMIFTETQTGVTTSAPARPSALRMSRDERQSPPGACPSPPAPPPFPPEACPSPRQV